MSAKMSQKEYLKKYLSGGSDKKKKKKDKKTKNRSTTVKIIDDDEHGGNSLYIDEELLLTGEDAPQIVGIIDASGASSENKWKSIGCRRPDETTEVQKGVDDDPWGKKATSPIRQKPLDRNRNASDHSPPRRVKDVGRIRRDSDQSPPRIRSNARGNQSPTRRRSPGPIRRSSDQSPPRKRSPVHRRKNSDHSPPRRRSPRRNSDQSPNRRRSPRNADQSPPRKRPSVHSKRNTDQSPPRRRSPGRTRWNVDQSSPKRRSPAHSRQNSDGQPPRRNSRHDNDLSPVRIKREKSSDQSPPRRRANGNPFRAEKSSSNNSPPRRRTRLDSDQSPVRIKSERRSESPPPTHKPSAKMTKTLDGKRAGLQDAKTLKLETEERRRNEDRLFNKMSTDISGRDAEVQVRQSSSYRRRRKDLEEDPEVQRKKAAHEQQKKELYDRWNKGLKQIEAYQAKVSDDHYESSKPLARYSNDADLDEMLRQKERDDDPMLAYIRSKKIEQQQAANIPVMPKYKGSYPENRFGIPPGYRWDGVDRSSGYERKWFDVQNQKKALADEAYKYSTEDM